MKTMKVDFEDLGPVCTHNMPCAVNYDDAPAVFNSRSGVFQPSWKAQATGWRLIRTDTWLKRLAWRLFFQGSE